MPWWPAASNTGVLLLARTPPLPSLPTSSSYPRVCKLWWGCGAADRSSLLYFGTRPVVGPFCPSGRAFPLFGLLLLATPAPAPSAA